MDTFQIVITTIAAVAAVSALAGVVMAIAGESEEHAMAIFLWGLVLLCCCIVALAVVGGVKTFEKKPVAVEVAT